MALGVMLALPSAPRAQEATVEATTKMKASGAFDVTVAPVASDEVASDAAVSDAAGEGSALRRYTLTKTYHGELAATAKGEMLTVETPVAGSGVYVAVERVSGTLGGRGGSFALQHRGVMARGATELDIRVVEDSGTGELTGLTGRLHVRIEPGGAHFYELEYALP